MTDPDSPLTPLSKTWQERAASHNHSDPAVDVHWARTRQAIRDCAAELEALAARVKEDWNSIYGSDRPIWGEPSSRRIDQWRENDRIITPTDFTEALTHLDPARVDTEFLPLKERAARLTEEARPHEEGSQSTEAGFQFGLATRTAARPNGKSVWTAFV